MTSQPNRTDPDGVIAELPDLSIEVGHIDDMVILQQIDHAGQVDRIAIHKWQVLLLARHFGLLGKGAGPGPLAIELGRRLHVLHGRIEHLSHWLHNLSDSKHANLSYEQTYSLATCEIADAFVADVERPARWPQVVGAAEALNGGVSGPTASQETTR